ncbi:MAG: Signal transduction histidine kinase, nitrogen specific, NtrB [Desulfotomaculum sp. 46_80]|nr:MAG: Signal transduction histidine kinase, nitrogen specific, NtrB [Desulfotomaculum sp. 46_80]
MILNLTRNGLEAMDKGGYLTIKTFTDGQSVILAVKDQGKGILPEHMDKLYMPFFTTKDSGTGLGLAVCYKIAARHNAKIDLETSPAGTTFFVSFSFRT